MTNNASPSMLPVEDVIKDQLAGKGFETIELLPGSTFQDSSTVVICPTRGMIHHKVITSWQNMCVPMNQKRAFIFAQGDEVGHAYNNIISNILKHPDLSKWKYILSVEDDNVQPPEAHIRLLEAINTGVRFDGVSGLYFTKGDINMPMAYGDPDEYRQNGVLQFGPRNVVEAIQRGWLMEVNGIACGCSLWRMDLFREMPPPWFVTVSDVIEGKGSIAMTQDLYFCKKAREAGKRFAVDCRVKVGHLDVNTGTVY